MYKTIAIVEDDLFIQKLLMEIFKYNNHEIFFFDNAEDFLNSMSKVQYNLVLLDNNLPGQYGMDVISAIKELQEETLILMLTANTPDHLIKKFFALGGNEYIKKPFSSIELQAKAEKLLKVGEERKKEKIAMKNMRKNVDQGRILQKSFFPSWIEKCGDYYITSQNEASNGISGDFYNVIEIDRHRSLVFLGDVSGHGIRSGMMGSLVNEFIVNAAKSLKSPLELRNLVQNLQTHVNEKGLIEDYFTLVVGILDSSIGEFNFVSAGHPYIGVFDRDRKNFRFTKFESSQPIGLSEAVRHDILEKIDLQLGESLIIFSDGVGESLLRFMESKREDLFYRSTEGPIQVLPSSLIKSVLRDVKDDATAIHICPKYVFEEKVDYNSRIISNQAVLDKEIEFILKAYGEDFKATNALQRVLLVISEFCTNCLTHGRNWDGPNSPDIFFTLKFGNQIELKIFHDSEPYMLTYEIQKARLPRSNSVGGRGQYIIKSVASDLYEQVFSKLMVNQFFFEEV